MRYCDSSEAVVVLDRLMYDRPVTPEEVREAMWHKRNLTEALEGCRLFLERHLELRTMSASDEGPEFGGLCFGFDASRRDQPLPPELEGIDPEGNWSGA